MERLPNDLLKYVNFLKNYWKEFDSPLFEYKLSTFNVKRKEFCYAGAWMFTMNL